MPTDLFAFNDMNFNKWSRRMKPDNEEEQMEIADDLEIKEDEFGKLTAKCALVFITNTVCTSNGHCKSTE